MKDPVEVQPPGGERFFIVLRVGESGEHISLALLDDFLLDLRHGPMIENTVSKLCKRRISVGFADVVKCSIASKTD